MKIKVGTRGSRLALAQTDLVISKLQEKYSKIEVEKIVIKTKGDIIVDKSLDKIGDKGLFVSEIEENLRKKNIDMAIHSMKDLPSEESDEFYILPVLEREDPRDVLITKQKIKNINELKLKSIIGTGSKRRIIQIKKLLLDAQIVPIRGNVDTRIQKMLNQDMDATILALAGLNRLDIKNSDEYNVLPIDIQHMIPAPAQGVLACQVIKSNNKIISMINELVHKPTFQSTIVERTFLSSVNGSCHLPLGAYLDIFSQNPKFYYLYGDESCENIIKGEVTFEKCTLDDMVNQVKEYAKKAVDMVKQ